MKFNNTENSQLSIKKDKKFLQIFLLMNNISICLAIFFVYTYTFKNILVFLLIPALILLETFMFKKTFNEKKYITALNIDNNNLSITYITNTSNIVKENTINIQTKDFSIKEISSKFYLIYNNNYFLLEQPTLNFINQNLKN